MIWRTSGIIAILFLCHTSSLAQFTIYPVPKDLGNKGYANNGRTKELTPMSLPFWDDFSFPNNPGVPHDTLWEDGNSVSVNLGLGVNPPSLGVATFDGLNESGNPYSVNDALAKGIADKLISRPIKLDEVPLGERSSVYLSFYYQYRGNGEPPDPGDQLTVQLKNIDGSWITVRTIENDGTLDPGVFTQVLVPVSDEQYYFDNFQFKLEAFGRLSGPYDTWNVDYVFLNKDRFATDTSFPDRTINLPLTSILNQYTAMPFEHFIEDPASNLTAPILSMHNLEFIPGNTNDSDKQPITYDSQDSIFVYRNNTETSSAQTLDVTTTIGNPLDPLEFRKTPIQTLPDFSSVTALDSAVKIKLKLWINSDDNVLPSIADPLGDYEIRYIPIDFRHNDTTQVEYTIADYYAYDDGTAEYGAALNQPGALLAYKFDMKTEKIDTIVGVDFYFPKFGSAASQIIEIQILRDLSGDPGSYLHRETVPVEFGTQNNFWHWAPNRLVGVRNSFFIGWKQSTPDVLAIGLDKNTDSGEKIFFNINGAWEQNTNLTGSLMIRPVFGKGDGVFTAVDETKSTNTNIHPNPSTGTFFIAGRVDGLEVYDLTGRSIDFSSSQSPDYMQVQLNNPVRGIYVIKLKSGNTVSALRLIVE